MPKFVTLEHTTLTDPDDKSKPRTVTVRESAARVLLSRGYRRQGEPSEAAAETSTPSTDEASAPPAPKSRSRKPPPDNA